MQSLRVLLGVCAFSTIAAVGASEDPGASEDLYFPDHEWQTSQPESWDAEALGRVHAYAEAQRSTGLVIVLGGRIVSEQYWDVAPAENSRLPLMTRGYTADDRSLEDVASAQKSILSFLIGVAVSRGLLDISKPVSDFLEPGWSSADSKEERRQEGTITVQQLLSMTSGLKVNLRPEAEAGSRWRYNTRAYSKLVGVLEVASGQDLPTLTRVWLTEPLGMNDSEWLERPWITADVDANRIGFVTSARDLARFGLLMLRGGIWNGEDLLTDKDYLQQSIRPSQQLNPAYGYLWWLNGFPFRRGLAQSDSYESLVPSAPADLYAAQGALGRKLYVVPSLDLVVARLGDQPEEDFNQQLWQLLMATLPQRAICEDCGTPLAANTSQATSGAEFISWREHIIDDPTRGVTDLSGSDGLAMADLDGDGFEDIVSVHESDTVYDGLPIGHVRIAWGTQNPAEWHLSTLASGIEAAAAEDVTIADVNGDGYPDVLVACELAHLIYFQNPGQSARTEHWQRSIPTVTRERGSYIRAFFADFDNDGRPEVVAANKGAQNTNDANRDSINNISLYLPPENPLDADAWREQVLGRVAVPINSEPVDLDGDGDLDVVGGSRGEQRILWFENLGALKFQEHAIDIEGAPIDLTITGFNMDYADLNGDGRLDIISNAWPGAVVSLTQPEDPQDPWKFNRIGDTLPDQLVSVRFADIDGDHDLDIFTGAYSRGPRDRDGPLVTVNDPLGRIAWFENPGSGGAWKRHDVSRRKRGMYDKWLFRDLDHDGDLDALGTRGNSEPYDGVIWLEQLRSEQATRVFEQARAIDSQQMGPSETQ